MPVNFDGSYSCFTYTRSKKWASGIWSSFTMNDENQRTPVTVARRLEGLQLRNQVGKSLRCELMWSVKSVEIGSGRGEWVWYVVQARYFLPRAAGLWRKGLDRLIIRHAMSPLVGRCNQTVAKRRQTLIVVLPKSASLRQNIPNFGSALNVKGNAIFASP